jgi:adenylosuccinate synthase
MANSIIVLSGPVSVGKTKLAKQLEERFDARRVSTRLLLEERIRQREPAAPSRDELQRLGDRLDRTTDFRWLSEAVAQLAAELPASAILVVDSVRRLEQVDRLREGFSRRVTHIHLTASEEELAKRYKSRSKRTDVLEFATYEEVRSNRTERQVGGLARKADVVIDTDHCQDDDIFVRAASHIGLISRETPRLVDVIIGGQYGSEGKGHLAYHLAREYDLLMRVGGPNAGHQVIWPDGTRYTHRLLPSGTLAGDAHLVIGAGAVLDIDILLTEIADCQVEYDRLTIDPQAMIITAADKQTERQLVKAIGSTGQGGGAAAVRRIQRGNDVQLARDIDALRPFVRPVAELLERAFVEGKRLLLEGTQGSALSLYHGEYPHVTSRDTTVSGCLAEAGLPPSVVRKIVIVCRTYPIRVMSPKKADSGHMAQEIDWETIAERSGLNVEALKAVEKGSVSGNLRRVAEFDWALLRRAAFLNGATDVGLTFVDYLSAKNRDAERFDQLRPETIRFIEEVERVAGAPVSLISTRFDARSIIDRRTW